MSKDQEDQEMKKLMEKTRVSVTMSNIYAEGLDKLVESGLYVNRQEAILEGIRRVLGGYGIEPFASLIGKKPVGAVIRNRR